MYKFLSMKEYEEKYPNEWCSKGQFYLYRTSGTRFNISVEDTELLGAGLLRSDEAMYNGIDINELDANELADDFVEKFCDHLSIRDLRVLIDKLQNQLNE